MAGSAVKGHARRVVGHRKTELVVQPIDVGEQVDQGRLGQSGDERHDVLHDHAGQALALGGRVDRNVDDLHVQPVAHDSPHANQGAFAAKRHCMKRPGQPMPVQMLRVNATADPK